MNKLINVEDLVEPLLEKLKTNSTFKQFASKYWYCTSNEKNALLFIGINPSLKKDTEQIERYSLSQKDHKHPYFRRFMEISNEVNIPWTHIDLFLFRTSSQKEVLRLLNQENGREYLRSQIEVADLIIKKINPRVIVVSNALASQMFVKHNNINKGVCLGYDVQFSENLGTYLWGSIPVFFSSMLTGQSAFDRGSYQRLIWHIKHIVNKPG